MKPRNQSEEWIARIVPGKSFADIGGIGENASNERVTFAHSAGARCCVMADLFPTTHSEWDVFRKKCASLGMPAFKELGATTGTTAGYQPRGDSSCSSASLRASRLSMGAPSPSDALATRSGAMCWGT